MVKLLLHLNTATGNCDFNVAAQPYAFLSIASLVLLIERDSFNKFEIFFVVSQ